MNSRQEGRNRDAKRSNPAFTTSNDRRCPQVLLEEADATELLAPVRDLAVRSFELGTRGDKA